MTFDVAIVGSGIVGGACAFECSRAGLQTCVIDPAFSGAGATAAGMGHVVVMDDSEAQFALTSYSRGLWSELKDVLPPSCEYRTTGTLWVAADESEWNEVRRKHQFYAQRNVRTEILDALQLRESEPELRADLIGALLVPEDLVIYPPAAARFFLSQPNVARVSDRAIALTDHQIKIQNGAPINAGFIINAAGISAQELTPDIPLAIQPRKGHLLISDRYPGFLHHQVVELGYLKSAHGTSNDSVAFNVQPRATGQILIGSSRQFGVSHLGVEHHNLERMIRRAVHYMPRLAQLSIVREWTGFRASTPDKLPLIGRVAGSNTLFIAAGHEGLGITTALATARLIVDHLFGRVSPISIESYSPNRFAAHLA